MFTTWTSRAALPVTVPMSRAASLISRSRSVATVVAAARSAAVAVASSAFAAASVSGIVNMPRASWRTTASDRATSICVTGCVDGSADAALMPGRLWIVRPSTFDQNGRTSANRAAAGRPNSACMSRVQSAGVRKLRTKRLCRFSAVVHASFQAS